MTCCCKCNKTGRCRNYSCVKAGIECQGCLPIRIRQCINVKIPPGQPPASGLGPSPSATIRPVPPGNPGTPTTTRVSQPTVLSGLEPSSASSQTADITGELDTPSPIPTLPNFMPMADPSFVWGGVYDSATIISTISTTYDEVVCWRRNNFPVPTGKAGTAFVSELSRLFRAYAEGTALEYVALCNHSWHQSFSYRSHTANQNRGNIPRA